MSKVCRSKTHWGNHLWGFIHSITVIDYENNVNYNKKSIDILRNIIYIFPCPKCKDMYQSYLNKLELLDVRKPMTLFYWSIDLHNAVNVKLNKPTWSYDRAKEKWCNIISK